MAPGCLAVGNYYNKNKKRIQIRFQSMRFLLHKPKTIRCSLMWMRPDASDNTPLAMAKRRELSARRGSGAGWKRLSLRTSHSGLHRGLPQASTLVPLVLTGLYGHLLSSFMKGHDDFERPYHRSPFPPYLRAISILAMPMTSQWRWCLSIDTDCIRDQSYCKG